MCDCDEISCKHKPCQHANERKPLKHAALIKAWADGAMIQERDDNTDPTRWHNTLYPSWSDRAVYRIKAEPLPLWKVAKEAFYNSGEHTTEARWWLVADAVIAANKEWNNANSSR